MRPRRAWLLAGWAWAVVGLVAGRARAQAPMSQEEAGYRASPNGLQMCGTCTLFIRPDGCRVVAGVVERKGWCRLFDAVD